MKNRKTSEKAASAAGRVLQDENSTPDEKSAAASALAQAGDETISPAADLIRHVREALVDMPDHWREVFTKDLARIGESK
jgi:hypothetical protein